VKNTLKNIPARTSLASGLVVKQHLLERNKYPQPQVTQSLELLTGSIQSKQIWVESVSGSMMSSSLIEGFSGGAAGMFNPFNINYELNESSGINTVSNNISASGTITFNNNTGGNGRFTLTSNISNAIGNDMTNFQKFRTEGYITTTNSIPSSSVTQLATGTENFRTTFVTSSLITNISASGQISILNASSTNQTLSTFNSNAILNQFVPFVGAFIVADQNIFDDGGALASSSLITGVLSANQIQTSLTSIGVELENVNFDFRSGSSSGPLLFPSSSARNITNESFTFRTGSLSKGTSASTTFVSSSLHSFLSQSYYYDTTPQFNVTQSFTVTTPSLSGSITRTHRSQDEFYNGELSGSTLVVSDGELNEDCAQFKFVNPKGGNYGIRSYNSTNDNFSDFISTLNLPLNGFIQTWFQDDTASGPLPPPNPSG
jgi:hypothetical protein